MQSPTLPEWYLWLKEIYKYGIFEVPNLELSEKVCVAGGLTADYFDNRASVPYFL